MSTIDHNGHINPRLEARDELLAAALNLADGTTNPADLEVYCDEPYSIMEAATAHLTYGRADDHYIRPYIILNPDGRRVLTVRWVSCYEGDGTGEYHADTGPDRDGEFDDGAPDSCGDVDLDHTPMTPDVRARAQAALDTADLN